MISLLITAKGVAKSYLRKGSKRRIDALLSTDISIKSGELTVITGRSGSGKTTLLSIISGLLQPDEGCVLYDEEDIYALGDEKLSKLRSRRTGYIPQGQSILASLTVLENILLPASLEGDLSGAKENAAKLLDSLGLSDLKDAYPRELSGGELRRAALARALVNAPDVIFADEPTGALNRTSSEEVMDELCKLNEEGVTVMCVTHDSKVAAKCTRVLFIVDGNIGGEFSLDRSKPLRERERELNNWLLEMGW